MWCEAGDTGRVETRSTSPAVVVAVVCASVSAVSQVLAGFDFPVWLQVVFTVLTGLAAAMAAWGASPAAAAVQKKPLVSQFLEQRN
jgi:hypothetical protein